MKKFFALIIAMTALLLSACGGNAPVQQEAAPSPVLESELPEPAPAVEEEMPEEEETIPLEDLYKEESLGEDGVKTTQYFLGGPEGQVIRSIREKPSVTSAFDYKYSEFTYYKDGTSRSSYIVYGDGGISESQWYPNGTYKMVLSVLGDGWGYNAGNSTEVHYADNSEESPFNSASFNGNPTYQKSVIQGKEKEYFPEIRQDDDGSYWSIFEAPDGVKIESHCRADGSRISESCTGEDSIIESEFYEDGRVKAWTLKSLSTDFEANFSYFPDGHYSSIEIYNGELKDYSTLCLTFNEDGSTQQLYILDRSETEKEYYADESGVPMTYIENGTEYQGESIPESEKQFFAQIFSSVEGEISDLELDCTLY